MRFVKWGSAVLLTLAVLLAVTVTPPPTYTVQTGHATNGGKYYAIFRHAGRPLVDIRAHAQQVVNPRQQAVQLVYEVQEFGAATTATSASAGATASDAMTWGVPFPDNNYGVACQLTGTVTAVPAIVSTVHTATTVTKVHAAITAAAASNAAPGFDCVGVHF